MKKILLAAAGFLLIISAINIYNYFRPLPPGDVYNGDTGGIILFYGNGCPHCKNVDEYIMEGGVREKVQFQSLEVFNNKDNAGLLVELAKKCGMDSQQIMVPFLWNGASSACIIGDSDVIDFFRSKTVE